MADLRKNPITGHWVIVAENRGTRPREVSLEPVVRDHGSCPFCEGNEHLTPGEVLAHRPETSTADGPGWQVRVIPNKYPAITVGESTSPASGLFAHEVVIESPRHLTNTTELDDAEFAEVLDVYRERILHFAEMHLQSNVMIFKNNGPAAGATLVHLHSQLVLSSLPTADQQSRVQSFRTEKCPACEMIADAIANNRIVAQSAHYVVLCPHASRFCYEMWLLPREHAAHYSRINRKSLPELASLFRQSLVKLERTVKVPAYNYIVHTAPFDTASADHYHWHIEILPRITTLAGFELGTGCYINPVPPERAATELRQA
jgi:UDPglucose--hexose-1-phosphate uridylyltransferase